MPVPDRPTGLTRDAGWQIGASCTFPVDLAAAWELLLSPRGLALWLGDLVTGPLAAGTAYATADGTTGEVRSLREQDRVRLTWRPPGRAKPATVQLALTAAPRGTTVRFHTERLGSAEEREELRRHWHAVLDRLEGELPGAAA